MVYQQRSKALRQAAKRRRVEENAYQRGHDAGWGMGKEKAYSEIEERVNDPFPHDLKICGCEPCRIIRRVLETHCPSQGKG